MKTEVYSWRLSPEKKMELEAEAKREGKSVAQVLEEISTEWLHQRRNGRDEDEAEQERIWKQAMKAIGSIRGGDPKRAERSKLRVRQIIREKYERERERNARRPD
jgi:hypothetical protein